ncbi:MAG: flavin reductase family protein, partial [Bacteroidetes bacterium]|nr:flavin reductase family protein [Bacteroidota bacterium]
DLVARMGGDWYCRASGPALFHVPKPNAKLGIGIDRIPEPIRHSKILTGNDLGQLGNAETLPSQNEIDEFRHSLQFTDLKKQFEKNPELETHLHLLAKEFLAKGDVNEAWKVLLAAR